MNDIMYMFKKVYGDNVGYLLIDESVVNWSTRFKLLPIKLNQNDHINVGMVNILSTFRSFRKLKMTSRE